MLPPVFPFVVWLWSYISCFSLSRLVVLHFGNTPWATREAHLCCLWEHTMCFLYTIHEVKRENWKKSQKPEKSRNRENPKETGKKIPTQTPSILVNLLFPVGVRPVHDTR